MRELNQNVTHLHLGRLLKMRRDQWDIKQREVLAHLPGWTQANYSRLESGVIAPAFDQLLPIYRALCLAGVPWTLADRQQFLDLARKRIEEKKTHWEHRSDAEWAELRYQLANTDLLPDEQVALAKQWVPPRPLLAETRHLVGREAWLSTVMHAVQDEKARKLIVLQGPMGIGKSSELHRLASHFLREDHPPYKVIWLSLLPVERSDGSEACLDMFLGTALAELAAPSSTPTLPSLEVRVASVLAQLERGSQPVVLLVDNAEGVLTDEGILAACWEHFLAQFLRCQHKATIILATKEWPGWSGRERLFVTEIIIPLLTVETSVLLLQHLGLEVVPVQHLRAVSERVGGIPLCLEWVAALVQDPLLLDDWREFDSDEESRGHPQDGSGVTQRLLRLLDDPSLLRGHLATKLKPLLDRIIEKRLSAEACSLLQLLAVATVPLGKPALQVLSQRPRPLKELRDASLLVAYPHRVQLLPMVASAVYQQLTPEQVKEQEEQLIHALTIWLDAGAFHESEQGAVITELAMLLLKHHQLLEAAQLLTCYGWLSFNLGQAPRLATIVSDIKQRFDWQATEDNECGGLLIHYLLAPYLGKPIDTEKRAIDYRRMYDAVVAGKVVLWPTVDIAVTSTLMLSAMNELRFEEAQGLLEACTQRLAPRLPSMQDQQVSVLEKRAWLCTRWCEYAEEQGEVQKARTLRDQAITLYRQCIALLSTDEKLSTLDNTTRKRRLARDLNQLGYHLNRIGCFAEALPVLEQSIALKEVGYLQFGSLAATYGEKAEALAGLGRFQAALSFDEKAFVEVQRCANLGHTSSQEEVWIYHVNRGRLYLRLGRIAEAEQLLLEALPHIHARRRMYRMFAQDALGEIEQWRLTTTAPQYQLDWRWVERFRALASYDGHWWLAHAGLFTEEEQGQWDHLFAHELDDTTKEQLGKVLVQSRQRELAAAVAEQREPCLRYPAIDIAEVRQRIADLLQLDAEISQEEPNAIVRRLYHGAIEEEVNFLRLIEATHEGDSEKFWEYNRRLDPEPTSEEMDETLYQVKRVLWQGLQRPETKDISQRVIQVMRERFHLTLDLSFDIVMTQERQQDDSPPSPPPERVVAPQTAKRFFEAVLRESGYDGWQVKIDPNASGPRVEQGLRYVFLPDSEIALGRMRHFIAHELVGHVARCVNGERSLIGLLGIHTKNSLPTEEGLALYHERQAAGLYGRESYDWGTWIGTLATGLASGVVTPPQTFLSLHTFLESFFLLRRLLERWDDDVQTAPEKARRSALLRCLRTYRGVPNLEKAGLCYTKDVVYLRGLLQVESAVAEDATVLDRLAIGVVAMELLPDLQEVGMVAPPQPLRKLATDPDLESYIFSFDETGEDEKHVYNDA
jgi:tetratricopeptide (TPR) repeat protein